MLKLIQKEISDYEDNDITIVEGVTFNQKNTIDKIHRYLNSRFVNGQMDFENNRKFFFNIVNNPCRVETKATDFDTKHINIETAAGGDTNRTWYFQRDLKFWMNTKQFGKVLNRLFEERPKFGTVVLKTIKGVPHFIDLRNFVVEQDADTLDDSSYIIEKHLYTVPEFKRVGEKMGWENITKTIEEFRNMKDVTHIAVYERYGEIPDDDYKYGRYVMADVGEDKLDRMTNQMSPHLGVFLKKDFVKHPYTEFHRKKIPGRWLGVGVTEDLFEPQTRQNTIANLEAKGDYYNALRVWQAAGSGSNINLNRNMVDGQVVDNQGNKIEPIDMGDRNLSYFQIATQKWEKNTSDLTFSYDVVQGETLPAGTPLGSSRLAAAMATSHFDQLREDLALDIKEYLFKVILPYFEKESTPEHTLRLAGNDLDKLQTVIINQKANDALFKFLGDKKKFPTNVQYDAIKAGIQERVKQVKELLVKIPANFYKDLKYKINIIITGEQKDTTTFANDLIFILQAITTDPTMLQDPRKRKILRMMMEAKGISPADLDLEADAEQGIESLVPQKGAGGGVSRPNIPTAQAPQQTQQTL